MIRLLLLYVYTFFTTFSLLANDCKVNFIIKNGLLLSRAEVNNREGFFIIDTGAPELILNARHFQGGKTAIKVLGLDHDMTTAETKIEKFQWGCIEEKSSNTLTIALTHLEESLEMTIFGLIGYEILKQKELVFDFVQTTITQHHDKKSEILENDEIDVLAYFKMSQHLPIIEVKIGNEELFMAFDTGASINVLDCDFKDLSKDEAHARYTRYIGPGNQRKLMAALPIYETIIQEQSFLKMEYLIKNLQRLRDYGHPKVYGLLGNDFLLKCDALCINYKKRKIGIWKKDIRLINRTD